MEVSAGHVGGSIEVLDASDPGNVRLALRADPVSANEGGKVFRQHFDFLVTRRMTGTERASARDPVYVDILSPFPSPDTTRVSGAANHRVRL